MPAVQPLTADQVADLNPGIRRTVVLLRSLGFDTCDSGDGVTHEYECDNPFPYVAVRVDPSLLAAECDRMQRELIARGVPLVAMNAEGNAPCIQGDYSPADGIASIALYNVSDVMLPDDVA